MEVKKKFDSKLYYLQNKEKINQYNKLYWLSYVKKPSNEIKEINKNTLKGCIIKCNVRVVI